MATFTNMATLSYNGTITNSNVVTGTLQEVLTATKTAVLDDYVANDDVTYVISIVNSGTVPFTNLTVTDDLGTYPYEDGTLTPLDYVPGSVRYYINGILQAAPSATVNADSVVFNGISVPAGGNILIIYEAEANQFAPLGVNASITNTAVVSGGGLSSDLSATETITTEDRPDLTITKTLEPSVVTENGQLTYTFIIQNSGNTPAVATDDVIVTDLFDPILSDLTVTFNGTVWTAPANYTYDPVTGEFATVPGAITVPAATFSRAEDGSIIVTPGVSILTVTGTV